MNASAWILTILGVAGVWDLFVWARWGLDSGDTASWQVYMDARNWPAIGFLAGYAAHALTSGSELILIFGCVLGHIFGTMRGAK